MPDASTDTLPSSVREQYGGMATVPTADTATFDHLVPIEECDVDANDETATYTVADGCPTCGSDLIVYVARQDDYAEHPATPEWTGYGERCIDETCLYGEINDHLAPSS